MNQPFPKPEPKAVEILHRIKGVFSAKGFDGASMQDLARAAGMSAGNFYRYFPSKNAIIAAMVDYDRAEMEETFAQIMAAPDPLVALRAGIRIRLDEHIAENDGPLWAEIEAASARRPEIAAISGRMEAVVSAHLLGVFARISGTSEAEAASRFRAHAAMIVLLFKGVALGSCGAAGSHGDVMPELKEMVLKLIDKLLDEVAGIGVTGLAPDPEVIR